MKGFAALVCVLALRLLAAEVLDEEDPFADLFNKPALVTLEDSNFEHETQAATGATTGDWLVLFVSDQCALCPTALAEAEKASALLSGRAVVAVVHAATGPATAKRFGVSEFPAVILLRQGTVFKLPLSAGQFPEAPSLRAWVASPTGAGARVPAPGSRMSSEGWL